MTFVIEGKYLGTTVRSQIDAYNNSGRARSYAFFCPWCYRIWAVAAFPKAFAQVMSVSCKACRRHRYENPAGSIHIPFDPDYVAAFPDAVLRWEIQRHCDYLEQYE